MSEPYIGEIKICSFNFPPKGWALCNGQLLAINQNQALFSILGTTYGGNGQTTFALPDLRGRLPIHFGAGSGGSYTLGQRGGAETVTINLQTMPAHTHAFRDDSGNAAASRPSGALLATVTNNVSLYSNAAPNATLNPQSIAAIGGSQPHTNVQPYLTLNFVIALVGIFPSRN